MWTPPPFKPGLHNPASQLNELGQFVHGQQLQVAPPLVLETTGIGQVLRLMDESEAGGVAHTHYSGALPNSLLLPGVAISANLFTFTAPGVYLVTGNATFQVTTPAPSGSAHAITVTPKLAGAVVGNYLLAFPASLYCEQSVSVSVFAAVVTAPALFSVDLVSSGLNTANTNVYSPGGSNNFGIFHAYRLFDL